MRPDLRTDLRPMAITCSTPHIDCIIRSFRQSPRAHAGDGEAMATRRELITSLGAAVLAGSLPALARAEEPILTDDGLYKQSWFLESFLELGDDLDGAAKEGKRFAVMWELRGCPYCKETHL